MASATVERMGPVLLRRCCVAVLVGVAALTAGLLAAGPAQANDATPRECRGLVIPADRGLVDAVPRNGLERMRLACASGTVAAETYAFSVDVIDVTRGRLPAFRDAVTRTLRDSRGWRGDGAVDLRPEVAGDADFSVVLASGDAVAAADPACSADFSCRVGDTIWINVVRWDEGSSTFEQAGASLSGYRRMVVNHEVGHWLGFGHAECQAPGARAPVMQQQSKDLQGCAPHSWPLKAERQALGEGPGRG